MKKYFVVILSFMLLSSSCQALTYPDDLERWEFFFNNPVYIAYVDKQNYSSFYGSYVDKSNVIHSNHYIISTWKWMTYYQQSNDIAPKAAYTLERVTYDVTCKLTAITRIIHYDKKHMPISSSSYKDFVLEAIPGSIGENEIEAIIKYDNQKHNGR